jgi:DNA-binding NarL/FixJ family response regulator
MPIKVAIADTEFLMRRGLKAIIEDNSDFSFVAEAASSKSLKKIVSESNIDVLIIDHCCDDCFSINTIKKIKQDNPQLNILLISHEKSANEIKKVIEIGIKNYLLKDCDEQEINDAIKSCAKGEKYFCGQIIDILLDKEILNKVNCSTGGISERELEVIEALAEGKKSSEVAEIMNISYHTVVTHKKNIYRKLGIKTNFELIQFAIKTGILKS